MQSSAIHRARRASKLLCVIYLLGVAGLGYVGDATGRDVTYFYTDPQGTVLATTDVAGNIIATNDYRPFGETSLGAKEDGPAFTGHVLDADTSLVYMQGRYYDPTSARFISTDPRAPVPGDLDTLNRFIYANNNPYRFVDPDGRAPEMLGELRMMAKTINDAGNRYMVATARALHDQAQKTEVAATATVSGRGATLSASKALYNGSDSVSLGTSGWNISREASVSVKTELFSIDFAPDKQASATSYIGHVTYYDGVGGGGEVKWNNAGKLSVSLVLGTGAGGTARGAEVSEDLSSQAQKAQHDYLIDQEIRASMGIQPERPGMF